MTRHGIVLCVLFLFIQPGFAGSLSWITYNRWVTVDRVVDGDTFKTIQGEKIRLLGINTPEIQHDTSSAQPFGQQAKNALITLIAGKQVRLTFDKEKKDKYGRTLAHVYLRNGLWVNAALVEQGLAHVYTFAPNISAAKKLLRIEQKAIAAKRKMWGHKRWRVITPKQLRTGLLGQFRLIHGVVTKVEKNGWRFELGKLTVTVPKSYRRAFKRNTLKLGQQILVRGKLRISKKGKWFLSVYTQSDVYHIN
ncbi:thermonuclease family protein [Ghiorsea bivora]|uniref:thermonuclease family protein n=1 Tax=Ghiorsea bivora TaxID=1485545 RepID=UPI0012FD099B|nr:thermonuclease family protein [Ghiorsea bivora]